jgi:polar amino acid transport system substrate-binding protein
VFCQITTPGRKLRAFEWTLGACDVIIRGIRAFVLGLGLSLASTGAGAATIQLATNPWLPIQGPSMRDGGPSAAVMKAAAKAVGHTVEVRFVPWKRAKALAASGEADGLLAAWYTEARARRYVYTQPYYSMRVGLIGRKSLGIQRYETLAQIGEHTIGVLEGWGYPEQFRTAPELTKTSYAEPADAAQALIDGEVDLVAMVESVFSHHAEAANANPDAFTLLNPPLMKPELHVALNRDVSDAKALARDLDRGLRRIKANGTYDEIIGRYQAMPQLSAR